MLAGCASYVLWRPPTRLEVSLSQHLGEWLIREAPLAPPIPIISDVFADFCWAYALCTALHLAQNRYAATLALTLAVSHETAQYLSITAGSFDWKDICAYIIAVLVSSTVTPKFIARRKE